MQTHLTLVSNNIKTGQMPVSTTSAKSCPSACPLIGKCYASSGPMAIHWNKITNKERGMEFPLFVEAIRNLPDGLAWRHNQAGDLPGIGNRINSKQLASLVEANTGKRGWTYTHKPMSSATNRKAVESANRNGFTINLSANNLAHADELASLNIAPVVVILPKDAKSNTTTPQGRKVVLCPAQRDGSKATCATCLLCQKAQRSVIVGFAAHGTYSKLADSISKQ